MNKFILPVNIILGCVILGGFIYSSQISKQNSIERQQKITIEQEKNEVQAKVERDDKEYVAQREIYCYTLKNDIEKEINKYNISQSPELRVVDRGVREEYMCYEQKELKDIFYNDDLDSCLKVEINRTICKSLHTESSGDYYLNYESYYLYDILKNKKIDFNDGLNFIYTIYRGEIRDSEYEVMELINQYK